MSGYSTAADSAKINQNGLQMSAGEMSDLAQYATEILVERWQQLADERAWEGDFRDSLASLLDEDPPEEGHPPRHVIDRAVKDVLCNTLRLDHPRSFGFIPTCPTWPGVLADYLAAGFNVNAVAWLVASGPSQLEAIVVNWFRQWFGLPEGAGGLITSGGSAAALHALVAAREAANNPRRAVVYMSDATHSAQMQAARVIGIPASRIRALPSDQGRLMPDSVAQAVSADRKAGLTPMIVCANAGTSSRGAIDPLSELAEICADQGIWFHVDAAYGGGAILTQRGAKALKGIDLADSIVFDAHKWLFQPYEGGCVLVRSADALEKAFAIQHDVLQDTVWGVKHANPSDLGIQTSRSFRALKIWMSIQTFGLAAFRSAIDNGLDLAERAGEYIRASSVLELMGGSLSIVCFRVNPGGMDEDALAHINRVVLAQMFWHGHAFLSSTSLDRRPALRLCIVNHTTTWRDVVETLVEIEEWAQEAVS